MKKILPGLTAIFLSCSLWAQVKFNNLNEVLAFADKNSVAAKMAVLNEETAAKEEQLYRSTLKPRIDITSAADYHFIIPSLVVPDKLVGGSEGKFRALQLGLPFTMSSALELTLPLFNREKWAEAKRYALEKERAKQGSRLSLEQLHTAVAQAYYNALLAKELTLLAAESQKTMAQVMAMLEQRKGEGILAPVDYNRAKAIQADVDNAALQWSLLLSRSHASLHQLLSIPDTDSILLSQTLSIDWIIIPSLETNQRPAYTEAKASVMVAEQMLLQSRKAALPKLSLNGRYSYQSQVQKGQSVSFDMSSIGIKLHVPLFAGGYYKIAQEKVRMLTETAKLREQQILTVLQKEKEDWTALYTVAAKRQKGVQQKLSATADNLRIGQLSLKEGVMEFDEFNTLFQDWIKARMEHLQIVNEGLLYQFLLTQKP